IPNPNNAKSYLTGSVASSALSLLVNSSAVSQSVCLRVISFSFLATRSTCKSHGHINCEELILFHIPKSTPLVSFLTIHRRYILMRLQVDFLTGVAMCFRVRPGKEGRLQKIS